MPVGERAGDNLDTGSDIGLVVELTAVGGRFWNKSGFNIDSRRRRLAAAAAPPPPVAGSVNPIFTTSTSATADADVPRGSEVADF